MKVLIISIDYPNKNKFDGKNKKKVKGRFKAATDYSYRFYDTATNTMIDTADFKSINANFDNKLDNLGTALSTADLLFSYDAESIKKQLNLQNFIFGDDIKFLDLVNIISRPDYAPTLGIIYQNLLNKAYIGTKNSDDCDALKEIFLFMLTDPTYSYYFK